MRPMPLGGGLHLRPGLPRDPVPLFRAGFGTHLADVPGLWVWAATGIPCRLVDTTRGPCGESETDNAGSQAILLAVCNTKATASSELLPSQISARLISEGEACARGPLPPPACLPGICAQQPGQPSLV